MPRRSKGPRLWLRPAERDRAGKIVRQPSWVIRDGGRHIATGCLASETAQAQVTLATYIAEKYQPRRKERDIEEIDIADILSIYLDDCGPRQANREKLEERIARLNEFWGGRTLAEITGESCRQYVKQRGSEGGARRDLEDLRAALNHHNKEGLHRGVVRVVLPPKASPRTRWLTRDEAARLLWTCWRTREVQTAHRGARKGEKVETDKRPLRHLVRFILIGLYTGTRPGAIATASFRKDPGRSFVDLEHGIFYRLAEGRRESTKRQSPIPIPPRLLAHILRWKKFDKDRDYLVQWSGRPVQSVKTAFQTAVALAKLDGHVVPHTLRHTAATWMMQAGIDKWEAAGFLGMSVEMLDHVYGHHHPDHLLAAANAIGYRRRVSLPISLPAASSRRRPIAQRVEKIGGPGRTRTSNQTVMSGRL